MVRVYEIGEILSDVF